ncbi:MAG: hypothetical protein GAK35_02316 [Herbaspirillum frisingense]|uniref:Uncharacterized protein n=1 Tax=Herbaspirillum frisingense TaxID=92645 RepID=A0A7V8FWD8_9BURK|nr:MAG: hypothetical protein GAK35_02316 [Herbaspirillum frisingense]
MTINKSKKGSYDGLRAGSYAEQAVQIVAEAGSITGPLLCARLGISVYETGVFRKAITLGFLRRQKEGGGNINVFSLGPAANGIQHAAPNAAPTGFSLPERKGRAGRILAALYLAGQQTAEPALMAAHGLDGLAAAIWRNGPYKQLVAQELLTQSPGDGGINMWALTPAAMSLLEADASFHQAETQELEDPVDLVPARTAPVHRPFDPKVLGAVPMRPGAWDFRQIPSHFATSNAGKA